MSAPTRNGGEARRFVATGRVQGVGYRDWVVRRARELGLDGWVRNRADGSVEILAAGEPVTLDRLRRLLESGPPLAEVVSIHVEIAAPPAKAGFGRSPTA